MLGTGPAPVADPRAVPARQTHGMTTIDMDTLVASMPLAVQLGIELQVAGPDGVEGTIAWAPDRTTAGGLLHGGTLMTFADSLGAICAFLNLPEGAGTSTIESKTNFFRGVREGTLTGRSRPVHVGRRTIGVQTEVHDAAGKLVSLTFQTQAVLT
jgi:1,4-dihydroxy-2-naphthoyl-CoA hydrolase